MTGRLIVGMEVVFSQFLAVLLDCGEWLPSTSVRSPDKEQPALVADGAGWDPTAVLEVLTKKRL
jgi:hypothetical protein